MQEPRGIIHRVLQVLYKVLYILCRVTEGLIEYLKLLFVLLNAHIQDVCKSSKFFMSPAPIMACLGKIEYFQ